MKVNVLALDIEGGHGGSSRSLYTTVQHLDREQVNIEVWCKRAGKIKEDYANLGVKCFIEPTMPKVTALSRFSRNLYTFIRFIYDFLRAREFRTKLVEAVNTRFDVVHFNHESLAGLGAWLRSRTDAGLVFHNRTMLWSSVFARTQIRMMNSAADQLVFITENERDNVRKLGANTAGKVIYNPVEILEQLPEAHKSLNGDSRFKVCCLSNYSWIRGVDRMVEVAHELMTQGRNDVLFVVAGNIDLTANLPGKLGIIGRKSGDLSDYARLEGVSDMFLFLGHVSNPERVLAGCDLLVKPTREANPWGRDILEAMAMGIPVISFGTYDVFVKNNETGYLFTDYDAGEVARKISDLALSPKKVRQMGQKAKQIVEDQCNASQKAKDLTKVWLEVSRKRGVTATEAFHFSTK